TIPAVPQIHFGLVDVRDVADIHLRAMTSPAAKGQRFIAVAGETLSMFEVAKVLQKKLGKAAERVPTRQLPNLVVKLGALFSPRLRQLAPQVDKIRHSSNEKARKLLDWSPQSNEEVIVDTAQSLIDLGLVKLS